MYLIEVTDTYGGEANYRWVKRATVPDGLSRKTMIRKAKELAGWVGWCRVHVEDLGAGEMILRPTASSGVNQIAFVTGIWEPEN